MVRKDADVELLVNGGVDQVEVPDVVTDQMTWDQAEQVLEDAGLVPVYTPVASDDVEENHVISTDPAAGTSVASGSRVTVNVSTGPAEEMVTIPSGLVGDTLANVSAKLEDAGLTLKYAHPFFHEFVTTGGGYSSMILSALEDRGILGGLPLSDHEILWCATELNSRAAMDEVIAIVKEVCGK